MIPWVWIEVIAWKSLALAGRHIFLFDQRVRNAVFGSLFGLVEKYISNVFNDLVLNTV